VDSVYAILLTDLVASTALAIRLGEARATVLLTTHDRIARDLLVEYGGREIDKSDGFLLLFDEPTAAANYAQAYHRALAMLDTPLQARVGLHFARVHLRPNSPQDIGRGAKPVEVEGLAKSVAARAMSVAGAGQTIATPQAVAEILRQRNSEPLITSHGHWQLKGLPDPLELFELGVVGEAPSSPPADGDKAWRVSWNGQTWVPVHKPRHLPAERDVFKGRAIELQALATLLEDGARIVSILGIGGSGKTRLAIHYGWMWLGDYPGGVWFCDLADARTADGIASAVARSLDVPLRKDPIAQLGHAIDARGRCLLILDNFEQVAGHADATLGPWVDRAPDAQFIVTSRQVLGLPGEASLLLPPLRLEPALELFAVRARAAKPTFALTEDNRQTVVELVDLLDRLPLAIELAAARVRVMPPATLLARMGQRFRLLKAKAGRRDRHATLSGMLDWSWDLLSPVERSALAQLSVFEGGFTLEAAEAVLDVDAFDDAPWPVDLVESLVDKSLVRPGDDNRFGFLVTVQEYAAQKLKADGGEGASQRHLAHLAGFGTPQALDALDGHGGIPLQAALLPELDNLVKACRHGTRSEEAELAVNALSAAWRVLSMTGPLATGLTLADGVLALPNLTPDCRSRALQTAVHALRWMGRRDSATEYNQEALSLARELGDPDAEGIAVGNVGLLQASMGQHEEALQSCTAALALQRQTGNQVGEGKLLNVLGLQLRALGRLSEARAAHEESLRVTRESGDVRSEGGVLANLGIVHVFCGEMSEAVDLHHQALAIHRQVGNRLSEANVLGNLGNLYRQLGRLDEARDQLEAALHLNRQVGNRQSEGTKLGNLGSVAAEAGLLDESQTWLEAALVAHRETGNTKSEGIVQGDLAVLFDMRGEVSKARELFHRALELHRGAGDRVSECNSSLCLGMIEAKANRLDTAREQLEHALELALDAKALRLEGSALAGLGHVAALEGDLVNGRGLLERGVARLRETGWPNELAKALVNQAKLEYRDENAETATACLDEAEGLVAQLGPRAASSLGPIIAAVRAEHP